jgi:hypothetical protein
VAGVVDDLDVLSALRWSAICSTKVLPCSSLPSRSRPASTKNRQTLEIVDAQATVALTSLCSDGEVAIGRLELRNS